MIHVFPRVSAAARAVIIAILFFIIIAGGIIADFAISTWRSNQAVHQSEQQLCAIVRLVTRTPVPKPSNPKANPSRESSYEFYEAFVQLGDEYRC